MSTALDVHFSSKSIEWATPKDFFEKLNKEFNFTLDPCSTHENAKCGKHYTVKENGLLQDWKGETVFCNPPYNKPEIACKKNCKKKKCVERGFHITDYLPGQIDWIKKCYEEHKKHGITVVMLIPSRTDTEMFHKYILGKAEIRFIEGRLKFNEVKDAAPFPSMVVIYR